METTQLRMSISDCITIPNRIEIIRLCKDNLFQLIEVLEVSCKDNLFQHGFDNYPKHRITFTLYVTKFFKNYLRVVLNQEFN